MEITLHQDRAVGGIPSHLGKKKMDIFRFADIRASTEAEQSIAQKVSCFFFFFFATQRAWLQKGVLNLKVKCADSARKSSSLRWYFLRLLRF